MQELQVNVTYSEFKQNLDAELKKSVESFVRIGYLLKVARDTDILHESGYPNMVEFAKAEYNLSKDQVSRFIAINDRYSVEGYSDKLQERYEGYGVAKLSEMLTLPEAVESIIEPEMTRAEIQEIKREVKEEQAISDIEVMLEPKDTRVEDMNMIQKFMFQYFYENREQFIELKEVLQNEKDTTEEEVEATLKVLAPSGIATLKARLQGIGKMFLSIKGERENLELVNVRENDKQELSWVEFLDDVGQIYEDGAEKGDWERYYKEPFEKVAPVQQETPNVAAEQEESQIPGQMNVGDYPELQPEQEPREEDVDNFTSKIPTNVENTSYEGESDTNVQNVEENTEETDAKMPESVDLTKCETDSKEEQDCEEIRETVIENAQGMIRALQKKDYEAAIYILEQVKSDIKMLINVEKTS